MTAPSSIDPAHFVHEQLAQASPDLLRQMLTTFINTLMSAEADAVCGAGYGERSPDRTNVRNGYRPREFDTRAGTLELAIPRLRSGSYFPDWLLERGGDGERLHRRAGVEHRTGLWEARTSPVFWSRTR
jgi:transposase-like protein